MLGGSVCVLIIGPLLLTMLWEVWIFGGRVKKGTWIGNILSSLIISSVFSSVEIGLIRIFSLSRASFMFGFKEKFSVWDASTKWLIWV